MKNEILEEINRMKVLGGILSEATGPTQVLPRVIATLSRTALDDAILSAFASLENKGLITINKTTKAITKVNWNILSPDELKLLFSAEPVRKIFLDATTDLGVDITSSAQRASFIGKPFGKILKGYDDAANSIISTGGSSTGRNTTGTIPGPSNNNPHIGGDDFGDVDDLIKNTYKTSQSFQVFYHMIDNISQTVKLSKLDREKILLSWKQYGNHTSVQLEAEARKLVNTRKLEQYGWLKKLIAKGMEDPSKTIKIGGKTILALSLWVPLAYAGIVLGVFGIAKVTIFKNWINNNTNDPDVKDALLNSANGGQTGGIGDIPQN